MKIFLDSAEVQEIRECAQTGLIDGVTTNPSLIAKSGHSIQKVIEEICHLIPGPISAEVIGTTFEEMTREGLELKEIAPNVVIKVPLTVEGLKACRFFRERDIGVNVTLCFSASQALLAAKAGASFISPFIGRLDDISFDGLLLIEEICHIYRNYPALTTEVLAASVRHPIHVIQAAKVGADVVTLPAKIFKQLYEHPLTEKGLRLFLADWEKASQEGTP